MRQQRGRALRGALAAMPQSVGRAAPAPQRLSPGVYRSATGQLVGQNGRPLPGQQGNTAQQVAGGRGQGRPSEVVQGIAQGIGGQFGNQPGFADKMYRFPPGGYNPNAMGQAIGAATGAMNGQMNPQGMQLNNYMPAPEEPTYFSQVMPDQGQGAMNSYANQLNQIKLQYQQQFGQNMPMDKMYRYPQGQAQQAGQAAGQAANAAMEQPQQLQRNGFNFFNPKGY